jgi:hypothetical protein
VDSEERLKKLIAILLSTLVLLISSVLSAAPATAMNAETGEGVYIVPGSEINLVARTSNVPVQIKNDFGSDVVVHVHAQPTNPRVVIPAAVEIKIPGYTSVTAKVPVEAVANGDVILKVWLTTFSGHKLGPASYLSMNVNADVELTMLVGFGGAVLLLLGFGIVRTVRKRRAA